MLIHPLRALKAAPIDDDAFRLLAIPFGGPIPLPDAPRGADLDGEWFSERTDLKLDWLPFRLVDWHHRNDRLMGGTILGKAVDPEMDDDGWWVTVWLKHGERRVDLVRRLAEKGAQIFGSSETRPEFMRKASTGEILVWPYVRQTLSTSPQNTLSVLRPLKATLDDLASEGGSPTDAFFRDLASFMDDLATRPAADPTGEAAAKAGRVLSAKNEAALREATAALAAVLEQLDRYVHEDATG